MAKSKSVKKTKKTSPKSLVKHQSLAIANPDQRRGFMWLAMGSMILLLLIGYRIQQSLRLSFAVKPVAAISANQQSKAVTLRLPKYKVTLDVVESSIVEGVWQINPIAANHLDQSANPGESGNIIIYGHNSREVFGPLRWMSINEDIELTTQSGQKKSYRIEEIIETNPRDIQWVLPKDDEVLTLYTCSGFMNTKRYIVIARPIID